MQNSSEEPVSSEVKIIFHSVPLTNCTTIKISLMLFCSMFLLLLLLELKSYVSSPPLSLQYLVQNPTTIRVQNKSSTHFTMKLVGPFLTRECAHAHERVIAIMVFSLGRLVGWLVRLLTFGHAQ